MLMSRVRQRPQLSLQMLERGIERTGEAGLHRTVGAQPSRPGVFEVIDRSAEHGAGPAASRLLPLRQVEADCQRRDLRVHPRDDISRAADECRGKIIRLGHQAAARRAAARPDHDVMQQPLGLAEDDAQVSPLRLVEESGIRGWRHGCSFAQGVRRSHQLRARRFGVNSITRSERPGESYRTPRCPVN